ncbi:DUF5990 family protein [Allokutzneria oryzae]|uniref:DUF5990 family protein n=1 Tax=Allokutzneria oryzae TaxID=1378989 RepID=A0ABV6A184_9PSEU
MAGEAVIAQVRIEAHTLPGASWDCYEGVEVGVQCGSETVDAVPGDAESALFEFDVRVVDGDFRGPFVHGRKGERFLYLVWRHLPEGGEPEVFRRAKLLLTGVVPVPGEGETLVGALGLTDGRGGPLCAGVRPPVVTWDVQPRNANERVFPLR